MGDTFLARKECPGDQGFSRKLAGKECMSPGSAPGRPSWQ